MKNCCKICIHKLILPCPSIYNFVLIQWSSTEDFYGPARGRKFFVCCVQVSVTIFLFKQLVLLTCLSILTIECWFDFLSYCYDLEKLRKMRIDCVFFFYLTTNSREKIIKATLIDIACLNEIPPKHLIITSFCPEMQASYSTEILVKLDQIVAKFLFYL